jgi:hypothetical protein
MQYVLKFHCYSLGLQKNLLQKQFNFHLHEEIIIIIEYFLPNINFIFQMVNANLHEQFGKNEQMRQF